MFFPPVCYPKPPPAKVGKEVLLNAGPRYCIRLAMDTGAAGISNAICTSSATTLDTSIKNVRKPFSSKVYPIVLMYTPPYLHGNSSVN